MIKYDFDEVNNRLGTYCTQWDYIEDRFGRKDLLPFSISDTDFKIPKPITEKIEEITKTEIYGYSRWNHSDFKGSISGFFKRRFDCDIKEDWIVYSPSVMYSVSLLIRLLSDNGDKVVVLKPMYDAFFSVIQDNNRVLVESELKNINGRFEINFEDFEKRVKEAKLFLLCSPHNPTGRVWNEYELGKMVEICKKNNVKIISDEIHMDINLGKIKHSPLLKYYNEYSDLYLVSSGSKTFNTPGLICSYAIIPSEKIKEEFLNTTRKKDFLNSVSIFGMYSTMVGYTKCDDYIDQLSEYIKSNMEYIKDFLDNELPDFKFEIPEATYLAWINIEDVPFTSDEIQKAFIDIGKVAVMKGEVYGLEKYLRLNCGCPKSKLKDGLNRIKKAMDWLYNKN